MGPCFSGPLSYVLAQAMLTHLSTCAMPCSLAHHLSELLQAVVREHPLILGVELDQAAMVVKTLRAAGLGDDELRQLVEAFPGVLSKR